MKTIVMTALILFSTTAFSQFGGNPASMPNLDVLKKGVEIRAEKAKLAVDAAKNTYSSFFNGTVEASWKGFNFYRVKSSTGCAITVRVAKSKVFKSSSIRCK